MAGTFAAHRWAFVVILGLFVIGGFLAVAGERDAAAGGWLWVALLVVGVLVGWALYAAMRRRGEHGPRSH
jgi:uncharacterized membrane protein